MELLQVIIKHFYQTIAVLLVAGIGWIMKKALSEFTKTQKVKREQIENESKEQELIKQGMLALLRFRINRLIDCIIEEGKMTLNERLDLDDLYKAYEALGGNSRTHQRYVDCMKRYQIDYTENK
ncbi:hypothetical protein ABGF48_00785 [Helcococcus bovis]|uniref:hypothetical protein n=1 Tax=Helcococcus bovis TaxID=3153252 RepID=UPI0038BDBDF4